MGTLKAGKKKKAQEKRDGCRVVIIGCHSSWGQEMIIKNNVGVTLGSQRIVRLRTVLRLEPEEVYTLWPKRLYRSCGHI